jgi:hypothetical protein
MYVAAKIELADRRRRIAATIAERLDFMFWLRIELVGPSLLVTYKYS